MSVPFPEDWGLARFITNRGIVGKTGSCAAIFLKVATCIETSQVVPGSDSFWVEKLFARLLGALRRDWDTLQRILPETAIQQSQSLSGPGNTEHVGCF